MFHFLDSHHLFTNARVKCCGSGMKEAGIKREAWLKVARDSLSNGSGLSLALVEDLVDRQNNAFAQKTFSAEVEEIMHQNNDSNEAYFCHLMRRWYEAEDTPGLTALERCECRLDLREWLLRQVNFSKFPPPGSHIKGIPLIMFEGLLTCIERKIQIYPFIKKGAYNPRATGSLEAENLFGEFQDLDPRGAGIMRPDDVPKAISTACSLIRTRLDPNRKFFMHTSKAKVYPVYDLIKDSEMHDGNLFAIPRNIGSIHIKNHVFDLPERGDRKNYKRKRGEISKPFMTARGARPVREYHK